MSQAMFERAAAGRHLSQSAGTEPATHVHNNVVAAMHEEGIDLSDRVPRKLTDELGQWADVVITMGCGDACPVIPGKRYLDWELRDPSDLPVEDVRVIRDQIKERVSSLVKELDRQPIAG